MSGYADEDAALFKRLDELLAADATLGFRTIHKQLKDEPDFTGLSLKKVQTAMTQRKTRLEEEAKPKPKAKPPKGGSSTAKFLQLAMRLNEMTDVCTTLKAAGQLTGQAADTLDEELKDIEKEIDVMDGTVARDLRSMVSVIRGTIYQQTGNLTDEQVEKMKNAFTYANPRYWDEYYKKTDDVERYDWYVSWNTKVQEFSYKVQDSGDELTANCLSTLLKSYFQPDSKIMMLGCGNSDMSALMYQDGFEQIVNTDISKHLMEALKREQEETMPKMQWLYEDATRMSFKDGSFDVILDKGTLDAMEQNRDLVLAAVRECHRTLRPGGLMISITFNAAPIRVDKQLKEEMKWSGCYTHKIEKAKVAQSGNDSHATIFVHIAVR